jgi:hypothetical protein
MGESGRAGLRDEEFGAVTALEAGERYNHFVKRVAGSEWVWALADGDGLVAKADDEGCKYLAVWPHPRYAEACATDEWSGTQPTAIEVDQWWRCGYRDSRRRAE